MVDIADHAPSMADTSAKNVNIELAGTSRTPAPFAESLGMF